MKIKNKKTEQLKLFSNDNCILQVPELNNSSHQKENINSFESGKIIPIHNANKIKIDKIYMKIKDLISHLD